jgi:type VI secretion system protein ImpK
MTPRFSKAIDPVFLHVLGLLERISQGETPPAEEERLQIRGWIDQAEEQLGQSREWQLAKYAIVAWIDEVLMIDTAWDGRGWWTENALEVQVFNTRSRYELFYRKAVEASALPQKDALEVFYVCMVLGFRGLYRDAAKSAEAARDHQLPPDLETWARQTWLAIRWRPVRPVISDASRPLQQAPPLEGPVPLIWSALLGTVLAVFDVILGWIVFFRNT